MMAAAEYNFFRMNDSGVVDTAKRLKFADDGLATAYAHDLAHSGRIEIWSGRRRVGVIPAAIERRAHTFEHGSWRPGAGQRVPAALRTARL